MNLKRAAGAVIITCVLCVPFAAETAGTLVGVAFEPVAFDPAQGEQTILRVPSEGAEQLILRLFGPDWRQVRELSIEDIDPSAPARIAWDGRDDEGGLVPPEAYFPVIELTGSAGEVRTLDPTRAPLPGQVRVEALRFDREQGLLTYRLAEPARVTLLAGITDGGPLLRTLLTDVPRPAGERQEPWNGMDRLGVVDVAAQPGFRLFADAVALWRPSVIVTGGSDEDYFAYRRRVASRLVKEPPDINKVGGTPAALPKPRDITPEPRFELAVAGAADAGGLPVVSGRVPLKVSLDESVRIPIIERRFEIVLFVDQRFVTEVEDGRSPATLVWDSTQATDGEHLLTVNVATLPGQISAASLRVLVRNSP
jgi:hypothetical protein